MKLFLLASALILALGCYRKQTEHGYFLQKSQLMYCTQNKKGDTSFCQLFPGSELVYRNVEGTSVIVYSVDTTMKLARVKFDSVGIGIYPDADTNLVQLNKAAIKKPTAIFHGVPTHDHGVPLRFDKGEWLPVKITTYPFLIRDVNGENMLSISADSSVIKFAGKEYRVCDKPQWMFTPTDDLPLHLDGNGRVIDHTNCIDPGFHTKLLPDTTLFGKSKVLISPKPSPIPDSIPKPTYRYFLTHDPKRYFQALDSLNIISGLIGKSMLYEDALYWLNARARNLNILYYEGKMDSVKIELPKK